MRFRVSDGYSAAVEFEASTQVQFLDKCAHAINEFWAAKIPPYQTRKLRDAIKFHALELHTKTALDRSYSVWSWVAIDGYFVRVTIESLFKNYAIIWQIVQSTQRHGRTLADFLSGVDTWLGDELKPKPARPTLRSIKPANLKENDND